MSTMKKSRLFQGSLKYTHGPSAISLISASILKSAMKTWLGVGGRVGVWARARARARASARARARARARVRVRVRVRVRARGRVRARARARVGAP
jgi:hypothetical protein